jgi:hypothetical protein
VFHFCEVSNILLSVLARSDESEKKKRDEREKAQEGQDITVSYYSSVPNNCPGVGKNM